MKKHFYFIGITVLMLAFMSFILLPAGKTNKHGKSKISAVKKTVDTKPKCSCGTPTNVHATRSGGTVYVTWDAVAGAKSYSVGGYYSCHPYGFNYCATTNATSFPSDCWVTIRIVANCDNVVCTSATCSGGPSAPVMSN